jgi:hypothetical protein
MHSHNRRKPLAGWWIEPELRLSSKGFVILRNQAAGSRAGLLNPLLYSSTVDGSGAFHDITHGNNGSFSAGPGWDACTGWGTPDVSKLLSVIEVGGPA